VEGLLEVYEAQWCTPVRLEVLGGARVEERRRLGRHFSVIPYRACDEQDWDRAISLAWKLRDKGLSVPWLAIVIASLAIQDGVRLFAIDEHFKKISDLAGLALYEPGYGGMFREG
jgi:predicted nucleic acid-binding protein